MSKYCCERKWTESKSPKEFYYLKDCRIDREKWQTRSRYPGAKGYVLFWKTWVWSAGSNTAERSGNIKTRMWMDSSSSNLSTHRTLQGGLVRSGSCTDVGRWAGIRTGQHPELLILPTRPAPEGVSPEFCQDFWTSVGSVFFPLLINRGYSFLSVLLKYPILSPSFSRWTPVGVCHFKDDVLQITTCKSRAFLFPRLNFLGKWAQ